MSEQTEKKKKKGVKREKKVETLPEEKKVEEIKRDIIKISIPNYYVGPGTNGEQEEENSKFLFFVTGYEKKYLRYFYTDVEVFKKLKPNSSLKYLSGIEYVNDVKEKIKTALGINKSLKLMEDILDGIVSDKDLANQDNSRKKLIGYKKLERLKKLYNILVDFTAKLLHEYYWYDFSSDKLQSNGDDLNDIINNIFPIIKEMKKRFEEQIDEEFPDDAIFKVMKDNIKG